MWSRSAGVAAYFVDGRGVPAFFNGMATAADWMSAATFIGMAGTLYLQGFDGLAYILGWTGGFFPVAPFVSPLPRPVGPGPNSGFFRAPPRRKAPRRPRVLGTRHLPSSFLRDAVSPR